MADHEGGAAKRSTLKAFVGGGCSGAACEVLDRELGGPLPAEERAAAYLAGGILTSGYQCGQVWGAALAAGAEAYRRHGPGPSTEAAAVHAAGRLVDAFREQNRHVDCLDLTGADWQKRSSVTRYMITGGSVRCYRMLKAYLPAAADRIRAALPEAPPAPEPPVSCAAVTARRLGLSEHQTVMAAGLAGGIGLRGGGCGALGVAVWATGLGEGDGRVDFRSPRAAAVIERFLRASDWEFECAEIVGRGFHDLHDHAAHVRDGGCGALIDALAEA